MAQSLQPTQFQPNIPQETEEVSSGSDALGKVTKAYEASKRNQSQSFDLFRDMYRLWRFYKEKGSIVKVFNPSGFAITIGLLSKMFVKTPKILATARDDGFDESEKLVSSLLEYQFDNPTAEEPMDEEYVSFITEMFVCGTAVAKVCWETQYITQFEEQPTIDESGQPQVDELGQPVTERVPIVKKSFDDPTFEHIPIENFYYQPGAKSVYQSKYCIYEKWVDLDYLREQEQKGIYKDIDSVVADSAKKDTSGVGQARGIKSKGNNTEKFKDKVHLLEYWEDDRIIVVAGESTVIRDEDNPDNHGRKPFVTMRYVKVPHEFCGIGALEPIQDLQKVQNITLTQRIEYASSLLSQQFGVVAGREVDEDAILEGYPVVHMSSPDSVFPLNKGAIPQSTFLVGDEISREIEKATGFSGYSGGTPASAQDKTQGTMGGIQTIVAEAQTKFDLTLKRFEKNVLRKTAQLFLELDRQYLPETEEKLIKISSAQGTQRAAVAREVLNETDYQVEIVPGSVGYIDKQTKYQNFMTWTGQAVAIPGFKAIDAVIEAAQYLDIENPDRFFTSPEEMMQQQQMQQQEQMGQQEQGMEQQQMQQEQGDQRDQEQMMVKHQMDLEKIQAQQGRI